MTFCIPLFRSCTKLSAVSLVFMLVLQACSVETEQAGTDLSETDCSNPTSTVETNHCMYQDLQRAEVVMERYLIASREQLVDDPESLKSLESAQTAWLEYRKRHCESLYTLYREGTIRGAMKLGCDIMLTEDRTFALWGSYLTTLSGEPLLPEPDFEVFPENR